MNRRIYLARHGQDEDNAQGVLNGHRDSPLTNLGVTQAEALAQNISQQKVEIQKIYASPLQRAYQTAKIVADKVGLEKPEILKDLIERDFGTMTGKLIKDIERLCAPDIIKTDKIVYFLSPERCETFPDLVERGERVLASLEGEVSDVLLVTHGDVGKMIYAAYYGLDWQEVLTMFHFGNSDLLLLSKNSPAEEAHVFKTEQYNH